MTASRRAMLVLLFVFTAATAAPAADSDAPADRSFGPFKYTAISVRTKIDALARAYRERWQSDDSLIHDAEMIASSYDAWASAYPHDRWLAPTAYHLAQLYAEIQTPAGRAHAKATFAYVAKAFPGTKEGHLSRVRLAQGFPALQAETPVTPTPNPYASPTPSPTPEPTPAPTATASAAPTSSPAPTPAPAKTPRALLAPHPHPSG